MLKPISFTTTGQKTHVADMSIYRLLPNRYADAVGPFVFLDHFPSAIIPSGEPRKSKGTGAHPHRGIATLTYLLHGESEHYDSRGHHAKVHSGGVQWMKAGNGIIHDEVINPDPLADDRMIHGFQFWINLPPVNKAEDPAYLSLQADEIPQIDLPHHSGWIKIIVGEYETLSSRIPNYSKQFLFHIHMLAGAQYHMMPGTGMETAALLPSHDARINGLDCHAGEFIELGNEGDTIEIENVGGEAIDILLFGGEHYTEPIVAHGPFVMNSDLEIAQAYKDFHAGKYGAIQK